MKYISMTEICTLLRVLVGVVVLLVLVVAVGSSH